MTLGKPAAHLACSMLVHNSILRIV